MCKEISGPGGTEPVMDKFRCNDRCVIYAISCVACNLTYIGQTGRRFQERMAEHIRYIKKGPTQPLYVHFRDVHHKSTKDMRVTIVRYAPEDEQLRKQLELDIISRLGTWFPAGLNLGYQQMRSHAAVPANPGSSTMQVATPTLQQRLHSNPGTARCGARDCGTCRFTMLTREIHGPRGSYQILDQFTCATKCVIYAITCVRCELVYVGHTARTLRARFGEHMQLVKSVMEKDKTELTKHFKTIHSKMDMRVTVLQTAPHDKNQRERLEKDIIRRLGTMFPDGLNVDHQHLRNLLNT